MSENIDYMIKQRVKEILKASKWRCRICDIVVEAKSKIASDDVKDSVLREHIINKHLKSPYINHDMKDEYLPGYFKPIIEVIQPNVNYGQ
jgi:chorismate mutase